MHPPTAPRYHPVPPYGQRTGVLIVNLGTPTASTAAALRPYLREFLSDPRVVEVPRWFWIPLLYGIIVPFRAPKSAHAYAQIWNETYNASPLRVITESQERILQRRLGKNVLVRHAMRYGKPSIPQVLSEMKQSGCGRIIVLPLYPQYAGATVGTVTDQIADWLKAQRWQPAINIVPPYYAHPAYIAALADSVKKNTPSSKPRVLIASFHGMPLKACEDGDVYYCHSHKTARLLAEKLNYTFCKTIEEAAASDKPALLLTFQSRFGKAEWLKPYMADVLAELPRHGINRVSVICPAFAADCVETLEEIAMGGKDIFTAAGGQSYIVVPCLNDSPKGMNMLVSLLDFLKP